MATDRLFICCTKCGACHFLMKFAGSADLAGQDGPYPGFEQFVLDHLIGCHEIYTGRFGDTVTEFRLANEVAVMQARDADNTYTAWLVDGPGERWEPVFYES